MAKDLSFNEIKGNIQLKKFMPVYLFQGEESYYIDVLTDLLIHSVVDESQRDFNQTIVYGLETDVPAIINACRRYPMMSEWQLVVVKEAQLLKNIDELVNYVKNPLQSTVLVINYKYGKLDGRKKLTGEIAKAGIVFESKKLYDSKLPDFIITYLRDRQINIPWSTAQILTDYLGNDLSKITNELDKLCIALPAGQKQVTDTFVEQNIGVSREFNDYELQKAIAAGNVLKAVRIARYFEENQKKNPIVRTLTILFGFFSNLMICQYENDKSKSRLTDVLGFKWDMQIVDYMEALKIYTSRKTMKNISLIREYDARAKGFQNSSVPPGKLLIEAIFKLMH
ncbi:MAG: DNA polymerase III subunit delta [Dysgonamonadaceae bacterium]|jgi:DNA polymerase-3 subunit delta|nr:DNA polymerase III subunit delta [Dysgonamonadaceae bacterium]